MFNIKLPFFKYLFAAVATILVVVPLRFLAIDTIENDLTRIDGIVTLLCILIGLSLFNAVSSTMRYNKLFEKYTKLSTISSRMLGRTDNIPVNFSKLTQTQKDNWKTFQEYQIEEILEYCKHNHLSVTETISILEQQVALCELEEDPHLRQMSTEMFKTCIERYKREKLKEGE